MNAEISPMDKFNFMLGKWNLNYRVPKSSLHMEEIGAGKGEAKKILNNRHVVFDYHAELTSGEATAHAVFAWDERRKIYRYWWFEDSGEFMEASCDFINDDTLCLNWYNSLLVQTFERKRKDKIVLLMKHPLNSNEYELVLEVEMTRIE